MEGQTATATATPAAPILGDAPVRPAPAVPAQATEGTQPAPGQPSATPAAPEPPPYEHPRLEKTAKGKYRTVEDFANAYEASHKEMRRLQTDKDALETRLGSWKGPPRDAEGNVTDYELAQSPESLAKFGPIDKKSPEYQFVNDWAKRHGASQEAVNELMPLYEKIVEGDIEGQQEATRAMLVEHYGTPEAMSEALNNVWNWMEDQLGETERPTIRRLLMRDHETGPLLERLIKKLDQVKLPNDVSAAGGPQGDTEKDILAMRQEPNWSQDPAKVARYNKWLGDEAARRTAAAGPAGFDKIRQEATQAHRRG